MVLVYTSAMRQLAGTESRLASRAGVAGMRSPAGLTFGLPLRVHLAGLAVIGLKFSLADGESRLTLGWLSRTLSMHEASCRLNSEHAQWVGQEVHRPARHQVG